MTTERERLVERRDLVTRDLEELAIQVEAGEVAVPTASRLRETYEAELASLAAAIRDLGEAEPSAPRATQSTSPEQAAEISPPEPDMRPRRSPRAIVVVSVVLIGVISVLIAVAARSSEPRAEAVRDTEPGELTIDPASVSNEQLEAVVAANPDIIPMRMALADRYYDAEDWTAALDHYLYVAETTTAPVDESKALARIGWMAYLTGLPQEAERYVATSLQIDPANTEAALYIGFVTLYGLDDPETAIPQLEAALELPNVSPEVRSQIEAALQDAREGSTP